MPRIHFAFFLLFFAAEVHAQPHLERPSCSDWQIAYDSLLAAGDRESALGACGNLVNCLEAVEGDTSLALAVAYRWWGNRHYEWGNASEAEEKYLASLQLLTSQNREQQLDYSHAANNLSIVYRNQGNFEEAEKHCLGAMAIRKHHGSKATNHYASSLINLAGLYRSQGRLEAAAEFYLEGLELSRELFGDASTAVATAHNNLAVVYSDLEAMTEAGQHYQAALDVQRALFGPGHPNVAITLNNLAIHCRNAGQLEASREHLEAALEIQREALGVDHPEFARTLSNLATNAFERGDFQTALTHRQSLLAHTASFVRQSFVGMSREQMRLFWEQEEAFVDGCIELAQAYPPATGLAFDALLFGKGLLLSSLTEIEAAINEEADAEVRKAYAELVESRRAMLHLRDTDPGGEEYNFHAQRAERHEKLLSRKVSSFSQFQNQLLVGWRDVQAQLSTAAAAIEIGQYRHPEDGRKHYLALVVRPGAAAPVMTELCTDADLAQPDGAMPARLPEYADAVNQRLERLYDVLWKPLLPLLDGVEDVYYCGVGDLAQIPLHALNTPIDSTHRRYVMDDFNLHALSTARLIANGSHRKPVSLRKSALALGYINYNGAGSVEDATATALNALTSRNGLRGEQAGQLFATLPQTLTEIEELAAHLGERGWEIDLRTAEQASEHGLKEALQQHPPGVLHFATHGFAFSAAQGTEEDGEPWMKTSFRTSSDPLARTGLLLSGGNYAWMGQGEELIGATGDDGVLTAAEIAALDLRATSLVVLSACETGNGAWSGMEGTMGHFRAFKLAGVRAVVQSFWTVPDRETRELMGLFYADLAQNHSPESSFALAQSSMRQRYPHSPYKWAAFVYMQ